MTTIAQDLGGVVRLLEKATPGEWPEPEASRFVPDKFNVGDGAPYMLVGRDKNDLRAAVASVNFLRAHSAEIAGALRDAERWQTIESAPRDGSAILAIVRWMWSDKTPGEAQAVVHWHKAGFWACAIPMNYLQSLDEGVNPTHWRPLPAPPAQDSAMQHGVGGGDG